MKKTLPAFIIILLFIACNSNDAQNQKEKELTALIKNVKEAAASNQELDSASLAKLSELVGTTGIWQEIKSDEGNFRMEFPNFKLKKGETTQIIDDKEITLYHYSMNTQHEDHDNLGYRVDYSFWPKIKTIEQINEEFDIQRDYVLSATNSTLEYENIIDSLNYPGRELYLTIDGRKMKAKYRMYFANGIFYKLMVITEDGKLFNNSQRKFIDSFHLLTNE